MKDRPKLGRGLRDVSRFFLSGSTQPGHHEDENPSPDLGTRTTCILSPASPLMQSVFTANLALESAKRRLAVRVRDHSTSEEVRVATLMRSLLDGPDTELRGAARILLYGLPAIDVQDDRYGDLSRGPDDAGEVQETPGRTAEGLSLVNGRPHPGFVPGSRPVNDAVIITGTDEVSLLRAYIDIKAIHAWSPAAVLGLVFDEPAAGCNHHDVYSRFSGFVRSRLAQAVEFLGTLVHDEQLERSICEGRPLVMHTGESAARDALMDICDRFFHKRPPQDEGTGS